MHIWTNKKNLLEKKNRTYMHIADQNAESTWPGGAQPQLMYLQHSFCT